MFPTARKVFEPTSSTELGERMAARRETARARARRRRLSSRGGRGAGMEPLGDAIGEAIATFFADPVVGLVLRLVAGYMVVLWIAAALWVFVDMRRRTHEPRRRVRIGGDGHPVDAAAVPGGPPRPPGPASLRARRPSASSTTSATRRSRSTPSRAARAAMARIEEDWLVCPRLPPAARPSLRVVRRDGRAGLVGLRLVRGRPRRDRRRQLAATRMSLTSAACRPDASRT